MAANSDTFSNRSGRDGQSFRQLPKFLVTPRARWPRHVDVTPQIPPAPRDDHDIVITFIGHATFLIRTAQATVLTDPMFSKRASPVSFAGPKRVHDPGVRLADLPRIDVVLLSHNHYDHCDLPTLRHLADRFQPLVITPSRNKELLEKAELTRIEQLGWWQSARKTPFPVTVAPAQHFSARTPFDRNQALWGSFVFELAGKRLFFAGDTGYSEHFRMIRARAGRMDLALLPIGAYEPRWFMKPAHMNPEEAVQTFLDLGAGEFVAMHWGTFRLTDEPMLEPPTRTRAAWQSARLPEDRLHIPRHGQTLVFGPATSSVPLR